MRTRRAFTRAVGFGAVAMLLSASVPCFESRAAADDDEIVNVGRDGDGDGKWDDANGDGVPDQKTSVNWKQLAKCGISRASAVSFAGWQVASAAAFTCLIKN